MKKYKAGDLFTIPMKDGRWAIGQVICALQDRFDRVLSFGVLSIGEEPKLPEEDREYITFKDNGRHGHILFASATNMRRTWKVVGHLPLTEQKLAMQWFHVAGDLYHNDEWIRKLAIEEYPDYPVMSVAGNERVQIVLAGYEATS